MDDKMRAYELASRRNKNVMLDCVDALGDYAALLVSEGRGTSAPAKKLREAVSDMVPYWGLDADSNDGMSVEAFLRNFDNKVDDARIRAADVDTYSVCSDALTGLALHGEDLIGSQGSDAMHEILTIADLLDEVGDYFGFTQETEFAEGSARWLRNSVAGMLKEYDLPGQAVEGVENKNYDIKQAVLFDNDMGYAFGHNPNAASPYVTWQMFYNKADNKLEYEWGNYFSTEEKALVDYIARHKKYEADNKVTEVALPAAEPELDEWRTYKAEIHLPDTEYPHLEVFGADNDVDAVNKANELASEQEGAYLLEVHELNEEYDSIRQIDLRFHDPEARRFMDVDIIDFLGKIAGSTILHYPQDFKIDIEALWKEAIKENPSAERLMWHCSQYGTHMLSEDEVFIKDTGAHNFWVNYRPNEPSMVGYVIEITGCEGDSIKGNVFDVGNYYNHAQYVRENSTVFGEVSLTYANDWGINAGKTLFLPKYEYDSDRHRLMSESGNVVKIQYHPAESVRKMADILQKEKANHMAMPVGDTQEHLQKLNRKLAELRGVSEQTQNEVHAVPSAMAVNGDVQCFDIVVSTGDSDYPFLVGEVNAVHKLGTPEHNTENTADDVFVDFNSEEYSEDRKREIAEHFSRLYGEPKRFDEDLPSMLFNVIMAPEHLIKIKESDLGILLESRDNCEKFCNSVLADKRTQNSLKIYHADFYDPEVKERMEIIAAVDDMDAWRQANEICAEGKGIKLLELNEAEENGDMREIYSSPLGGEMPAPDHSITEAERYEYGYSYDGMHPLNKDRAMELFMQDCPIYLLWNDDTESMVNDSSEITNHDGIFGIETDDWERSTAYKELIAEKISGVPSPQKFTERQTDVTKVVELPKKQEKPKEQPPQKPKRANRGEDR